MISESIIVISSTEKFEWAEYLVFISVLLASLGIGIYFGFFGNKNKTNEEFLMAGRSMSIFPVAMSLICSFVSAITLLGQPAEMFYYGALISFSALSIIPMTIVLAYLFVPVYVDLQLTSAYQYFEWRFGPNVRKVASLFALIYLMLYMPTSVLGPSLALDQVAGIHYGIIAASTFTVCTIYSTMGGLKAVLWTDTLQAIVMTISLVMIIIFGVNEVGGLNSIWEIAEKYGRVDFWNSDIDPRTRYTGLNVIIGEFFTWLSIFAATQAQIQRYNSVTSLKAARITLIFNMIGMITVITLCSIIGLIIFKEYHLCDPVAAGVVNSSDQLVPFFVLQVLGKYSGIPGVLVAGLYCGSLRLVSTNMPKLWCTVSSALNALSAIITEDFVKKYKPNTSEGKLAIISKLISAIAGIIALGLVFIIALVNEAIPISPFATFLIGTLLGPILGMFCMGLFFPWANEFGTLIGVTLSLIISCFIGLGTVITSLDEKLPIQKLGFGNCTLNEAFYENPNENWKFEHANDSFLIKLFSMSFIYQTTLSTSCTLIFGLIFSFIFILIHNNKQSLSRKKVNRRLLSGPILSLWVLLFGKDRISNWVDFEYCDFLTSESTRINENLGKINYGADLESEMNNNNK